MTFLTLGEAEREVGVTKSTISRAIKDGRLSAARNEHGHYQIDPAELFRVYEPIQRNDPMQQHATPSRNSTQPLVQPHATPSEHHDERDMVPWLLKRLEDTEEQLTQTKEDLTVREQALQELREAYAKLPSPEDFEARLKIEVERLEQQQQQRLTRHKETHAAMLAREQSVQAKSLAEQRQKNDQWKQSLAERQKEIQAAREEAEALSRRAEQERRARELLSERLSALESRGLLARLLNRKPRSTTAG